MSGTPVARPHREVRGMWSPAHASRELVVIWNEDGRPYGLLIDGVSYRTLRAPCLPLPLGRGGDHPGAVRRRQLDVVAAGAA